MYNKALKARVENIIEIDNWDDFMKALNARKQCMAPWCKVQECEIAVKEKSKNESQKAMEELEAAGNTEEALLTGAGKTLCIPNDQTGAVKKGDKCFACGKDATVKALWGRSY